MYSRISAKISQSSRPQWLDYEIKWMGTFEDTLRKYWGVRKFDGWKRGKKRTQNDNKYERQLIHILEKESLAAEKFRNSKLNLLNLIEKLHNEFENLKLNPGDDVDEWNMRLQNASAQLESLKRWKI